MRSLKPFLFLLCSLCWNYGFSKTIIEGKAPEYSGTKLPIAIYADPVSFTEKNIAEVNVDASGSFSASLNISEPQLIFIHSGVYFLYMYVEPDARYTVVFPPKTEKTPAEKLNPYFEEKQVHLIVESCSKNGKVVLPQEELNFYIRSFDDYYGPYMAKYALNVATQREIADRDSTITKIESLFPDTKIDFYNDYKNYKIGFLRFMSLKNKSRAISNQYFLNKPILYNNPGYTELFNQVYDKYLVYFGRTANGKTIYDDINLKKSYSRVKNTLSQDNILENDSLKELVLLKGIHDEFYSTNFSRGALLIILDSLIETTQLPVHKEIGLQIRDKVTRLLTGYLPPDFKLYDQQGKVNTLADFKGKYTYLMFCTTQNYACITEFEQIKKLYQKHSEHLNIVTILMDDNFNESKKFIKAKELPWTFLHFANDPEIIKKYDIRAFPTYFLIDREGKLAISPAPSPSENFELSLFNEMRAKGVL
jgi:peroxiredoxin